MGPARPIRAAPCRNTHPSPFCFLSPFPGEGLLPRTDAVPSTAAGHSLLLPGTQGLSPAWAAPPGAPPSPNTALPPQASASATFQPLLGPRRWQPRGRLQRRVPSQMPAFLRAGAASLLPPLPSGPVKEPGARIRPPLTPRPLGPNEGHVKGLTALEPSPAASGNRPTPPRRLVLSQPCNDVA